MPSAVVTSQPAAGSSRRDEFILAKNKKDVIFDGKFVIFVH